MDEASKTNKLRSKTFFKKYLSGKIIDIGAGTDLVCTSAEGFDIQDGDANFITRFRGSEQYDSVHSSHCLEHMHDPLRALNEWWQLVKPGGYLILVVPDEDLYEQGIWPSNFNEDHKSTFRLRKEQTWSPVSFDVEEIVRKLPNANLISAEIHDCNYNYNLKSSYPCTFTSVPPAFRFLGKVVKKVPFFGSTLAIRLENFWFKHYRFPIDQTRRDALAQIQIVAQKVKS